MKTVTIVGGGLVGSLLAVMLSKEGYAVNVFERRPDVREAEMAAGKSINLALSERGWKALEIIGAVDEIKKISLPMYGRRIHKADGELNFQQYGMESQAIYSVSRGELNKRLLEIADEDEKVNLFFNHKCINVNFEESTCTFFNSQNNEEVLIKSDLIFGADGAFSSVRFKMQKTKRFNYEQIYLPHGYKELLLPANDDGSFKMDTNALHIWPRGEFMLIALPNLDGSFTCTLFMPYEGETSFSSLDNDEKIKSFFAEIFPDFDKLMPDIVENYHRHPLSDLAIIKCFPWVINSTALIGDASHAIVPFYGQGMNSGFEDCTVLHELIEKHQHNWEKILDEYQYLRKPDADAIAELAMQNYVEMRDLVGDPDFLLRKKIEAKIYRKHPEKWIPLYSQVTFSHIRYSDALKRGNQQEQIMDKIMNKPDIHNRWDSDEIENDILSYL